VNGPSLKRDGGKFPVFFVEKSQRILEDRKVKKRHEDAEDTTKLKQRQEASEKSI